MIVSPEERALVEALPPSAALALECADGPGWLLIPTLASTLYVVCPPLRARIDARWLPISEVVCLQAAVQRARSDGFVAAGFYLQGTVGESPALAKIAGAYDEVIACEGTTARVAALKVLAEVFRRSAVHRAKKGT